MRIRRFFHIILAVIALGIVWQVASTWSRAMPGVPSESARTPKKDRPATALPARRIRAGQRLAQQITDKDLFSPDRKRPVVVVQQTVAAEPIPPPSHLSLVGVLLTPSREEAFLADSSQGNRVTRVQKGEQIERYHLTRLTASEATLSLGNGGGEVALPLALLSSKKAKSLPRLIPKKTPVKKQTKQDQGQAAEAQTQAAVETGGDDPARIRENIRQLQRRLRTIRRQAARERRAERERAREAAQAEEPEEPEEAEEAQAAESE